MKMDVFAIPTNIFPIIEPPDQEIGEFYVVQERRGTDFEASKLWKGSSGRPENKIKRGGEFIQYSPVEIGKFYFYLELFAPKNVNASHKINVKNHRATNLIYFQKAN